MLHFRRLVAEAVLDVINELHGFVVPHMGLNPGVDIECAFDRILRADHQLAICQQSCRQNCDRELVWIRGECS